MSVTGTGVATANVVNPSAKMTIQTTSGDLFNGALTGSELVSWLSDASNDITIIANISGVTGYNRVTLFSPLERTSSTGRGVYRAYDISSTRSTAGEALIDYNTRQITIQSSSSSDFPLQTLTAGMAWVYLSHTEARTVTSFGDLT